MSGQMQTIGIVGGGAWGTALAAVAARAGRDVILWAREPEVAQAINTTRENTPFLPGVSLPQGIEASTELAALSSAEAVLMVAPAQHMRAVSAALNNHLKASVPAVICAKGIEQSTGALMSEVLADTMPGRPLAVLSGPTFAHEVAKGLPAAVTLASKYNTVVTRLTAAIGLPTFRPYASRDVVGAQVGGALKNVIAIAAGVVVGKKLGENARAALLSRAMMEMLRFSEAHGGKRDTIMGLSGLGDLILTCGSPQSRNMSLGLALGEGRTVDEVLAGRTSVAEGLYTAKIVTEIAARKKLYMPICGAVAEVVTAARPINDIIEDLLHRPFGPEVQE